MKKTVIEKVFKMGIKAAAATLLALAAAVGAYSADAGGAVGQKMTPDVLSLSMQGMEETAPESIRVGAEALDEGDAAYAGKDYPIVNRLLADNSGSNPSDGRIRTKQMSADPVTGTAEGERFALCTYDEDLRFFEDSLNVIETVGSEKSPNGPVYGLIIGGIALFVGIGLFVYFILKRKKKSEDIAPLTKQTSDTDVTEGFEMADDTGGRTEILVDDSRHFTLYLTDLNDNMRHIEAPLRDRVTIGRDKTNHIVLDNDGTISHRHCEIFASGSAFLIRDLNSSNGTYVDGVKVTDQAEIYSGSIIRLGRSEFEVEIR